MFPLIQRISFQTPVCTLPGAPSKPQAEKEALGWVAWEWERAGDHDEGGGFAGLCGREEREDTGGDALLNKRCRVWLFHDGLDEWRAIPALKTGFMKDTKMKVPAVQSCKGTRVLLFTVHS